MSTVEPETSSPSCTVRASGACTFCASAICSTVRPNCDSCCGSICAASTRASALGLPVAASKRESTLSTPAVASRGAYVSGAIVSGASVAVVDASVAVAVGTSPVSCPVPSARLPAALSVSDTCATSDFVTIEVGSLIPAEINSAPVGTSVALNADSADVTPDLARLAAASAEVRASVRGVS